MAELRDALSEWQDWDWAGYQLATILGVIAPSAKYLDVKHLFWTDNSIGNFLHETLEGLVRIEVLERRDEPDIQYRCNPDFVSRQ